jgi:hypothetical protein
MLPWGLVNVLNTLVLLITVRLDHHKCIRIFINIYGRGSILERTVGKCMDEFEIKLFCAYNMELEKQITSTRRLAKFTPFFHLNKPIVSYMLMSHLK